MNTLDQTLDILAKYGYTVIKEQSETYAKVSHEFEHINLTARISTYYDNEVNIEFHGEVILQPTDVSYDFSEKKDIDRLKGRANRFRRLSKVHDDIRIEGANTSSLIVKQIKQELVDKQIVFALQITKSTNDNKARLVMNGYTLDVDKNLKVTFRLGTGTHWIPVEKAIEIANLLPRREE